MIAPRPEDIPESAYYLPVSGYERRKLTTAIILHHTRGPASQTVEQIRAYHVRPENPPRGGSPGRGYRDIGYHWIIGPSGEIEPGRPEWAKGAHAAATIPGTETKVGWNYRSVGVALRGDFTEQMPTDAQIEALYAVVVGILSRYPGCAVMGHGTAMALVGIPGHTDCPGGPWASAAIGRMAVSGILDPR